jgi:hypothetical protein
MQGVDVAVTIESSAFPFTLTNWLIDFMNNNKLLAIALVEASSAGEGNRSLRELACKRSRAYNHAL